MSVIGNMNVDKNRTTKKLDREVVFSKVEELTLHDENKPHSVAQLKKSAPYRQLAAEEAKVLARQERRFDEYKVYEVNKLVKQIGMLQNYRKKLETNMRNDPELQHKKDEINAEYNIIETQTQEKIDSLKQDIVRLSEFYQERKAKLEEQKSSIELSKKAKGEKSLELDYLYRENQKLVKVHEEKLAEMMEKMKELNAEMEDNHREYTQKIARVNDTQKDTIEQINKCKEVEDICVLTAKLIVDEMRQKEQGKQNVIISGFARVFGDSKKTDLTKNVPTRVSYTQRIVQTLRGIYNYLCKKLVGKRRDKARTQGRRAIEKQLESDFSKPTFIDKTKVNISF